MCFVEFDDEKPCIRVTEFRPQPMRISIPGPPRRRRSSNSSSSSSSASSSSSSSANSTTTSGHDTTIVRPPRRLRRRFSDHYYYRDPLPCPPPERSYTTINRTRTREREELVPVRTPRPRRWKWVDVWDRDEPARYVEYVEPEGWPPRRRIVEEVEYIARRNRNLSIRKNPVPARRRFSIATLRGLQQPGLSKKMNRLVKSENSVISAYERAGRERVSVASQLSEWGESTDDDAVSDISDKLGVLLAEMGEQEDVFAQNLEDYRTLLKHIRETESSVQPSRDYRAKVADDIQKQKLKDPNSLKLETLEQELVRAEAQNLVAEAQLTNMTRQKLKEAYDVHLAAVIERGEKQILLARHARRLLNCLDDAPVAPGDARKEYDRAYEAKQVIEEAEKDLLAWQPTIAPIQTSAGEVPANTLLPAPARKAKQDRNAGAVAPDEDVASSNESVRDLRGSVPDSQEYDSVGEPTREYGGLAGTAPATTGYTPRTTNRFEKVVPDEQRYVGGHVRDTTRAAVVPDSMEYNGPVAEGREPVGTDMGPSRGIDESITGASGRMEGATTEARDFNTGDAADMNPSAAEVEDVYSSTAYERNAPVADDEDFYETATGPVQGMDSVGMESQGISGAEAGATGMNTAMPQTQGYGRSTVGTMTEGVPETSGMKFAGYATEDWNESTTRARGTGSDMNGPMGESRNLDESTQGTAMNGRGQGQTRNVEETVSQFTNDTDGSVTTRTVRETVVTRNPAGLFDGAQDTREKLQTQPHMLGGFGLQTIGVPY
ncbi:Eisosome component PIL1-domain-containing protein [Aspergillus floccosus]